MQVVDMKMIITVTIRSGHVEVQILRTTRIQSTIQHHRTFVISATRMRHVILMGQATAAGLPAISITGIDFMEGWILVIIL